MEKQAWSTAEGRRVEWFLIAAILLIILAELFLITVIDYRIEVSRTYLLPLVAVMAALVWLRKRRLGDVETALAAAFALWFFISRLINSDKLLTVSASYSVMISLACLVLFPLPSVLDAKGRKNLMMGVALFYTAVMGVLAYLGVIAMLTGSPFRLPFSPRSLGAIAAPEMRLYLFYNHPNTFACLLYIALPMLFYLTSVAKRLLPKLWYALLGIGICAAIYFTGSTTGILITVFLFLMMGLLLLSRRKRPVKRMLFIVAAAIVCVCVIVAGMLLIENELEKPSATGETQEHYGARFSVATATFGSRVWIWETGIQILKDRPIALLVGELHENAIQRMANIAGVDFIHLHNSWLETLVVGGMPALLLMLASSVLIILHSLRLIFNRQAPLSSKILTLPLFALFIHSMVENYLFTFNELPNLFFFLFAGLVVYESKFWRNESKITAQDAPSPLPRT